MDSAKTPNEYSKISEFRDADIRPRFLSSLSALLTTKAATILRLLGNETIQFNTRGKKSESGLRKQLNIDVKSTTKFYIFFKYMNIFIYFTNIRRFRFRFLYFKYLQTLILCVTTFYKTAFYYNVFRRRLKSRNIKMFKDSSKTRNQGAFSGSLAALTT